ncbi:MAG: LysM peptidoglycan-binding domain-containing protein [Anaerolineae bacterium]|nr:LysM peptidoglycan-binding domain-containing protein [Anaerolineae bacterium]
MAQTFKTCPICNTPNPRNAAICITCGATLAHVGETQNDAPEPRTPAGYDPVFGETDLSENRLRWAGINYFLAGTGVALLAVCGVILFLAVAPVFNSRPGAAPTLAVAPITLTATQPQSAMITNTARPTLFLATVTLGTPTATPSAIPSETATQGPCNQQVQPNDSLIAIVARCGHRDYSTLLQVVLDLNNLSDPNQIQIGQTILVPWPTPTFDPNATATSTPEGQSEITGSEVVSADLSAGSSLRIPPTETLLPGVVWHRVQANENIIIIALTYGANLRTLSELNPEVTFSQCDFGLGTGGPNCIVQIFEGQLIRVPAPTPTPTIQPTPSGSETPTASPTPTFNLPTALSPSDRAFFSNAEIVTLRWIGTGSLGDGEAYLVTMTDLAANITYTATTTDLFFIVPEEWHNPGDGRHDYRWTISVIQVDQPDRPYSVTEPRQFTWQGRGNS